VKGGEEGQKERGRHPAMGESGINAARAPSERARQERVVCARG